MVRAAEWAAVVIERFLIPGIAFQNPQRRIEFDQFSRNVSANRNGEDYEKALYQIQRNSSSRALSKRLTDEQKEKEIEWRLLKVRIKKC